MIEDKKLGLKVAEDPVEEAWQHVKDNATKQISDMKIAFEIQEAVIKLAETKLKH